MLVTTNNENYFAIADELRKVNPDGTWLPSEMANALRTLYNNVCMAKFEGNGTYEQVIELPFEVGDNSIIVIYREQPSDGDTNSLLWLLFDFKPAEKQEDIRGNAFGFLNDGTLAGYLLNGGIFTVAGNFLTVDISSLGAGVFKFTNNVTYYAVVVENATPEYPPAQNIVDLAADASNVPAFSAEEQYSLRDVVNYNGSLYVRKQNPGSGEWNDADWAVLDDTHPIFANLTGGEYTLRYAMSDGTEIEVS